jgi:hypothetical protein
MGMVVPSAMVTFLLDPPVSLVPVASLIKWLDAPESNIASLIASAMATFSISLRSLCFRLRWIRRSHLRVALDSRRVNCVGMVGSWGDFSCGGRGAGMIFESR